MKAISQEEIIILIADINEFADRSELLIKNTRSTYEREKENMQARHNGALTSLEKSYKSNCTNIRNKSQATINNARSILAEIEKLDSKLSSVDKYYVKTKKKREELLSDKTSEEYADAVDYFSAMEQIQSAFNVLFKKYSEDILPALINGLNYLFSSQRKKDYEELIVLRNTVTSFVKDIETDLPQLTTEGLAKQKESFDTQKGALIERHRTEMSAFEDKYLVTLDDVADRIYDDLDNVIPDEFVDYLSLLIAHQEEKRLKVNSSDAIYDGVLNMAFLEYQVDVFVQSSIVASVIKEKCAKILVDGSIRFPMAISTQDASPWLIASDNCNSSAIQMFTHSVMYSFLSAAPVSHLDYIVIDPENRGNSVSPFFDSRKKFPELFDNRFYFEREDISTVIRSLNDEIGNILQERLGNQYDSIFDYAVEHIDYNTPIKLLLLYDFPRGFDEQLLVDLRNILRNGGRCGIFSLISYVPEIGVTRSAEYEQSISSVVELTRVINQREQDFTIRGLPLIMHGMPEKMDFNRFFSKYMLIFEGIKNRGIAFSAMIKRLVDAKDTIELNDCIMYICDVLKKYDEYYGEVPEVNASFPDVITLGTVLYPPDVFSDSVGYNQIVEKFGVGNGDVESNGLIEMPLTFDLGKPFNLFLNAPESSANGILELTHHVMWNFLSFLPVTKVNITVCDNEKRGNSIIPFLEFRKKCPEVFDHKIYTSQDAINDRLQSINAQIDEFIQEKLGNRYNDILEYNINTPNRAEPVNLLVIYDFPSGMDGRSLDLLLSILRNGSKCGVYVVICYNPEITYSRYDSIDERLESIMRYCASIEYKDGVYYLLPYNLQINIADKLSYDKIDKFIVDYVERSDYIKKQGLSFRDIIAKDLFNMQSSKSLSIPVGIGDGDSIINISIGEGSSHHGLIAGATGSGKSTLLHTLIMSSMLHYSPDQLHLYLMDFKSGTEFKVYESVKLPHIQLLALDAMQEFGESILENLISEMERRGGLFKEAGQTSLKGYTEATGESLPRILVIMDEFQILFNDSTNRKVAMNCAELTKRIVTEGRAFGIHLLMATQSTKVISDLTLSRGTIEQMRIRIGLKCGEDDARYLFSDENDTKALAMMKGPIGTAVMNQDYTEMPNIGFRAAYCDDETQEDYLRIIADSFTDAPYTLQIFEGGRTTKLLDYYLQEGISKTDELPVKIHMGTLIKVAPPFSVTIDKKKKHNLLICGANERMANMLSENYIISALLNTNASVYCIDGDSLVGDDTSQEIYDALSGFGNRFRNAIDRADIIRFVNDVYKQYSAWKKQNSDDVIFVVIKNLQFIDIVKSMLKGESIDESEYLDEYEIEIGENTDSITRADNPFAVVDSLFSSQGGDSGRLNVSDKLIKLIEDGSGFGIHFVISSLEYQTVKEYMYYGENVLSKFPERIIFSIGDNDADSLIENVSVSGLRDNTVYYSDGIKNTFQMKPYIAPGTSELADFIEKVS